MNGKKGALEVHVIPTKLAKSAVVKVGFKFGSGCYWTLNGLKCGACSCSESPYSSAMMYAVYKYVQSKIAGSAADELNNQIVNLDCNYQNGEFSISAVCTGTVSGARKVLSSILRNLVPGRVYPAYKESVKQLNDNCEVKLSTDKRVFLQLADEMTKSLKSVQVVIAGKANYSKDQFEALLSSCAPKLNPPKISGDMLDPKDKKLSECTALAKTSGYDALFVKRYIESSLGTDVHIVDGHVCGSERLKDLVKKLNDKDRITRHVGSKYQKFKDELPAALAYLAAVNNLLDTSTLKSLGKAKVTGSSMVDAIKKAL